MGLIDKTVGLKIDTIGLGKCINGATIPVFLFIYLFIFFFFIFILPVFSYRKGKIAGIFHSVMYSRPSVVGTLMARLQRLFRTRS